MRGPGLDDESDDDEGWDPDDDEDLDEEEDDEDDLDDEDEEAEPRPPAEPLVPVSLLLWVGGFIAVVVVAGWVLVAVSSVASFVAGIAPLLALALIGLGFLLVWRRRGQKPRKARGRWTTDEPWTSDFVDPAQSPPSTWTSDLIDPPPPPPPSIRKNGPHW